MVFSPHFNLPKAFSDPDTVIIHRGLRYNGYSEFSLNSLTECRNIGALAEVDVRACRNGIVVIHDATTDRVAKTGLRVSNLTVNQFERLGFKNSKTERLLSLPSLLNQVEGIGLLLDLKEPRIEEMVIEALRQSYDAIDRVMLICRGHKSLVAAIQAGPEYYRCLAIQNNDQLEQAMQDLEFLKGRVSALSIQHRLLKRPVQVEKIHAHDIAVMAWCITNQEQYSWCRALGVLPVTDYVPERLRTLAELNGYGVMAAVN